jgi:hypothetical protein
LDIQKTARLFGWLFIATFVTSIAAKILFVAGVGGSFSELRFIPGAVSENSVYLGVILEFGVIVTNIATAVVIYPIVKRQSEKLALGYVTARIVECAFILVGIISIISIVSVSDALVGATGAEATALAVQGSSLAATYDWAFLFGPGLVVGFGNGLILGYLMYRSGLVPVVRAHPFRGLRERIGSRVPAGPPRDHLGRLDRHLRGMEGLQTEPDHNHG